MLLWLALEEDPKLLLWLALKGYPKLLGMLITQAANLESSI
jgi:hypothetical protein